MATCDSWLAASVRTGMRALCAALLVACGTHGHGNGAAPDADGSGSGDGSIAGDGNTGSDASSDGSVGAGSTICDANHWLPAVSVAGQSVMRFHGKTYVFGPTGTAWAVVDNTGTATTQAIPLPAGVTAMQGVVAEIALDGMPLVWFDVYASGTTHYYATRFDGTAFSPPIDLGAANRIHADAQSHIYAYGSTGLVEYVPGGSSIARGAFPANDPLTWNVGPDGTVYALYDVTVGSNRELHLVHLPHGSLSWSSSTTITTNAGYGFYRAVFAVAPDNTFHAAYMLGGVQYFRSHDAVTWSQSRASDFQSTATMIDPAPGNENIDPPDRPQDVDGWTAVVSAQDYDHVAIALTYPTSSLYTSSQYLLRRCMPFIGSNMTWPAERLAWSEAWMYDPRLAFDEHGMASMMTPFGLRVDVAP